MKSRKMVPMNRLARATVETDVENRLMDTGSRAGRKERVGYMERETRKYTLAYAR